MKVKKRIRLRKWVIVVFMIISLCGVAYSSYKILIWKLSVDENHRIKDDLNEKVQIIPVKEEVASSIIKVDFAALKEQNEDTIAYLKVPNTNIEYVVVLGYNNEYYLNFNFNHEWNVAGWIFGDYRNHFDETDRNLIIYGHETKDDSMFGTLRYVINEDWYTNQDNHKITLVTEMGQYTYQVFSTYSIKPEDYYISTSFENDAAFGEFVNVLKNRSIYDYGVEISGSDKILTLSSCLYEGRKRVVLHAKLIEKKEE